jgi:hypothetical protein
MMESGGPITTNGLCHGAIAERLSVTKQTVHRKHGKRT